MMSPQGIIPTAKSVVVCAIHHPDACIELGWEPEPQDLGPYRIQYAMNSKLDVISFKVARMLDDLGYKTVPIASSNIWRYREYKELDAVFSPDISHIYAAVAAGLGQLTYNGSVYTDKYGINQRFAAVITNAELKPDPVNTSASASSFCRECMKCVRECPLDALRAEKMIEIDLVGAVIQYLPLDSIRCEWESKYALCGECGFKYVGSMTNEYPEGEVNAESLANALKKIDPILKYRPVTAEICITGCPLANGQRPDWEGF